MMSRRHTYLQIQAIKAAVRWRDRHRCRRCGMTNVQHRARYGKSLHVHRLRPGSPYSLPACITLCCRCHGPQPRLAPGQRDLESFCHIVALPPPLYDALKMLADRNRRPTSWEIRFALIEHLRQNGIPYAADPQGP